MWESIETRGDIVNLMVAGFASAYAYSTVAAARWKERRLCAGRRTTAHITNRVAKFPARAVAWVDARYRLTGLTPEQIIDINTPHQSVSHPDSWGNIEPAPQRLSTIKRRFPSESRAPTH